MSSNLCSKKDFDVLIVEDEPILAMAMEVKLKKLGFGISAIATTPENAILHANNHHPDLALIDINLNASKSGIDVASHIWKNFNIPVIFLTSYYNDKILNQAMQAEPYAYLIKPCRNEELKAAINTTMHKHQFFFKNKNLLEPSKNKIIYLSKDIKFDLIELALFIYEKLINLTKNKKSSQIGNFLSKESIPLWG